MEGAGGFKERRSLWGSHCLAWMARLNVSWNMRLSRQGLVMNKESVLELELNAKRVLYITALHIINFSHRKLRLSANFDNRLEYHIASFL